VTRASAALLFLSSCTAAAPQPTLPAGHGATAAWRAKRADLGALRARLTPPGKAYSMNVSLELWVERLGMRMRGRGAVAVHPPDSLRMIMVGPGGTTAMDLWICREAFRLAIPAADIVRRGDADTPPEELRGLPVAFLRWFFLEPLGGSLLAAWDHERAQRFLLRHDRGVIHLASSPDGTLAARRLSLGDEERIELDGERCGHVHYNQRSTSIDLEVDCEKINAGAPPARAFVDPDEPHRPCVAEEGGS
jgi:hypothetical protein